MSRPESTLADRLRALADALRDRGGNVAAAINVDRSGQVTTAHSYDHRAGGADEGTRAARAEAGGDVGGDVDE
jgi:hypothetical protein